MEELIKNFPTQFSWRPEIQSGGQLRPAQSFIVCGMGGSALAAGLVKLYDPTFDLLIHRDYGLPRVPEYFLKQSLIILSSYSGNTEEVLDTGRQASERGLNLVVIASGGKLLDWAKEQNLPFIQIPDPSLPPRMALGYSLMALAKLAGRDDWSGELAELPQLLKPEEFKAQGKALAEKLSGRTPLIYSSTTNWSLAYIWKIKFNETAQIPAFWNILPESCHNELLGFDLPKTQKELAKSFHGLFLEDDEDGSRVKKRFAVLRQLYEERGLLVETINLTGVKSWLKIFSNVLLADWVTFYLAQSAGVDPEAEVLVEEFKRLIA